MDEHSILDGELPTMVVRCNNMLVLRSIITGQHLQILGPVPDRSGAIMPEAKRYNRMQIEEEYIKALEAIVSLIPYENLIDISTPKIGAVSSERSRTEILTDLPPCKVQRNYCCTLCSYYTQNPRCHLLHQRDVHGVRLSIHSCHHCQYASRYCQKLKRHIKMVHTIGSLQESDTKNEKPILNACKSPIDDTAKPNELHLNNQKSSPKVSQPSKPSTELPTCSKAPTSTQISVNAKTDPEAFFVTAYKNQLQIQLEYEQRLKNFLKTFNSEPKNVQTFNEASKEPIVPLPIENEQQNVNSKAAPSVKDKGIEGRAENEKLRVYSCRKCNYITYVKSRYNKHVKYHSMPMIQCEECEFRTTYKWNLTRHLRSHHVNGIYKCSVCTFSANMKQSLTSHESNHHSPPVGRSAGTKPIKRRRCRVGGSDLQAASSEPSAPGSSRNLFNSPSESSASQKTEDCQKESTNSNARIFSETEANQFQNNFEDPSSMEISDSENTDSEMTDNSGMELNGFEEGNFAPQMNPNKAPIHVDADFVSENLPTDSNQEKSFNTPTTDGCHELQNTKNEQQIPQYAPMDCSSYTSEASLSASTISAEEAFDRSSQLTIDTSPRSTASSHDTNHSNSNPSMASNESFNEAAIRDTVDTSP